MPGYESPLGNKQIQGSGFKTIDVPDESMPPQQHQQRMSLDEVQQQRMRYIQQMQQMEAEAPPPPPTDEELEEMVRQNRIARKRQMTQISPQAKKRLELLLGMIRTIRQFQIGENSFTLQSLKGKEMREAVMAAAEYDRTVQSPFEIRRQLLARSLVEISGVNFEQFIGSSELDAKLIFVEELDEALLTRMYDEYLILAREARDKYAIKTEAEAKELVQDIKKA